MRYIIKAGQPVDGKHWELEFDKGVAVTGNAAIADKYRKRGYLVAEEQPEPEAPMNTEAEPKKVGRRRKEG